MGFFVGPALEIELPVTGLAVHTAALYDQREFKIQDETFKQQSLVLPPDNHAYNYSSILLASCD